MKTIIEQLKEHEFNLKVFKNLPESEFKALKEDISIRGVQIPIEITKDNMIITGHQRVKACKELGYKEIESNIRFDLDTEDKIKEHLIKDNILRRQLSEIEIMKAGEELERIYEGRRGGDRKSKEYQDGNISTLKGLTRDRVAETFGMTGRTYETYKKAYQIAQKSPIILKKLEEGEISSNRILQEEKRKELNEENGMDMNWVRYTTVWNILSKGLENDGLSNLPIEIIKNVIYHYTKKGDLIGDCFAGSGQTKQAAEELERNSICSDINPQKPFIIKNDILKGLPSQYDNTDLIFLDPPYWNMISYGKDSLDKLNYDDFLKAMERTSKECYNKLKLKGKVALIIMPIKKKEKYYDLGFECYKIFTKHFRCIQRFCIPVVKQPHPIEKGVFIPTLRDLIIFERD